MIDPRQPDFENTPASRGRPVYRYVPTNSAEPPAVSVVTSFFNTPPSVFRETHLSVMRQSFQDWEWIIVNDGSSDETALEGLRAVKGLDRRIRVVDLPTNEGPSQARNVGFREARAEYVVMLDSDDLLEPTAIEKWLWYLHTHPQTSFVDSYAVGFGARQYLWNLGSRVREGNLVDNLITSVMVMIRRDVWEAVGGFDPTMRTGCEDWDFWLRCADAGYWGDTLAEYLVWYRRRHDHSLNWPTWTREGIEGARQEWRRRYPRLYAGEFPRLERAKEDGPCTVSEAVPGANSLGKSGGTARLLLVVPFFSMDDPGHLSPVLVTELAAGGYEITVCATEPVEDGWTSAFAAVTPDVFVFPDFLEMQDYPRFLRYLVHSRGIDVVMVSQSLLGHRLLPYLRCRCPGVTFVDFVCGRQLTGEDRGDTASPSGFQRLFDWNVVTGENMKDDLVRQGIGKDRIGVWAVSDHVSSDGQGRVLAVLLDRARRHAMDNPLPPVEAGLGLECARLAIECAGLRRYSRRLWADYVKERQDALYRDTSPIFAVRHVVTVGVRTLQQAVWHPREFLARVRCWLLSLRKTYT